MADATVPQQRQDDVLAPREERISGRTMPYPFRLPWTLALMWAMLVTLLAAFLLFGSVRVGAGTWNGRRMRASLIWERFVGYLSSEGFSPPLVGLLVVTVIIAMLGCAWLLWLAFALRDASPPDASPNE